MKSLLLLGKYSSSLLKELSKTYIISNKEEYQNNWYKNTKLKNHDIIIFRSPFKLSPTEIKNLGKIQTIVRAGSGIESIDKDFLDKKGISFHSTGTNPRSVSELGICLMLMASRNTDILSKNIGISWDKNSHLGSQISHKKALIIGLGEIGRDLCACLKAFNISLYSYDRSYNEKSKFARELDVKFTDLNEGFSNCDFIFLTCSLNDSSLNLITREVLEHTKYNATIINISRGGIINENDLIEKLNKHNNIKYASDVFTNEPDVNKELLCHPKCIALPHIGSQTAETMSYIQNKIVKILKS